MALRGYIDPFVFASVLALAVPAGAASTAAEGNGGKFYCCIDTTGKYICGDILPQSCYGRAYRELGADGRTLREVAAPLTPEQRAAQRLQQAADEEKRRKEAIAQKEQERKDQALLETYISLDEIEELRKRALDDVHRSISNAENRIAEIEVSRKKFEDEAEFYKNRNLPAEIEKGLADAEFEIKAQESIIETRKKELLTLQDKYDDDRQRFLELQRRKVLSTQ